MSMQGLLEFDDKIWELNDRGYNVYVCIYIHTHILFNVHKIMILIMHVYVQIIRLYVLTYLCVKVAIALCIASLRVL